MPSSRGEQTTKLVAQNFFKCEFEKVRPDWLKNPKTGHRLEIDIFNKNLGVGIEYQGCQHYYYSKFFHKESVDNFLQQQERDRYKIEQCIKKGILLIIIPYNFDEYDTLEHIEKEYSKFKSCPSNIIYTPLGITPGFEITKPLFKRKHTEVYITERINVSNLLSSYKSSQNIDGQIIVISLFTQEEVNKIHKDIVGSFKEYPEYKNFFVDEITPDRKDEKISIHSTPMVLGKFGALGNPSSFHHPFIRNLRKEINRRTRPFIKGLRNILNPELNIEQLIDRLCFRQSGSMSTRESKNHPSYPTTDTIIEGWVNLNYKGGNQSFTFAPTIDVDREKDNSGDITVTVFPGQWIIYDQRIVHITNQKRVFYHSLKQYVGFRFTSSKKTLQKNLKSVLLSQGLPTIPSGQFPDIYTKGHFRFPKMLSDISSIIHDSMTDKNGRPLRFMKSLKDAELPLYPEYTEEEIDIHKPQRY